MAVSLPAPSQLTMCKHSPDTILLQWRVSEGLSAASLLGYRVVVNGVEEGMVCVCVCVCVCVRACMRACVRMSYDYHCV